MSALLQLLDLSFSHSHQTLFDDLNLTINQKDKIGLVGHNGTGKSTLLSLIKGEQELDSGEIRKPNYVNIGIVDQFVSPQLQSMTLLDAVIDQLPEDEKLASRWQAESQLLALGFEQHQFDVPVKGLSGGQQNLLLIARALILAPQLLLMDEPGNHMDIAAMTKLSQFLAHDCQCPFLMISHDQHLLDNVCTKTVFLRDKRTYEFDLPFEQARERLAQEDEIAANRRELEEKEIKRLQSTAKRLAIWGREHDNEKISRKAKAIEKRAIKLDQSKTEISKGSPLNLTLKNLGLGAKQVLAIDNCNILTPDGQRQLLNIEQVIIRPGDRVALLGINGVGKSSTLETVRKAFAVQTSTDEKIRFNPRVELGYYDQELASLEQQQTRLDWLRTHTSVNEEELKRTLISAGVAYQDFDRMVNTLSGGEKARMMFMAFALNQPNFMILDEPTNHIDLAGKAQLTEQLMDSGATLLMTSHDRHFLDNVATRWLWIDQGQLNEVNSAQAFYNSLIEQLPVQSVNITQPKVETIVTTIDDEGAILERIDELESKLCADKARKAKFQKPELQLQWQAELDELWAKVS